MKKTKNQKGITLLALVITIIILLILAGISIASLTGSGLFGKTQEAKQKTENAQAEENATLGEYEQWMENYLENITEGKKTYTAYKTGDKVSIGEDSFYVIKDSGTNEEKVTLLAEKNIGADNDDLATYLKQLDDAGTIAFSKTNYWGTEEYDSDRDINNIDPENDTDAIAIAREYGTKKGGDGRLMTIGEAIALGGDPYMHYTSEECPTWINSCNFWIGSVNSSGVVYALYGDDLSLDGADETSDDYCGVRPVIEISKSKIS